MIGFTLIDRYILREYISTAVVTCFVILGVYIVFDGFTNLEEFFRAAEKHGGLLPLLVRYYACQSVMVFDRSSALIMLIAAMFTVTWIQRHQEMTAILAAGVPHRRVLIPIILPSVVITLLAVGNREVVMPQLRDQLARRPQDLVGDRALPLVPRYDKRTNILFRGSACYREGKRITEPNLLLPPELARFGRQLSAEEGFFLPGSKDHPSGYLLRKVRRPTNLKELASFWKNGEPVILTPRDTPWLQSDECFVASSMDFEQLCGGAAFRQFSSTGSLIRALYNPSLDFGADIRVAIHSRIVQPLADLTLLFLGLPLVIQRENRNVFAAIGLCALLAGGFFVVSIIFQQLGSAYYIPPALGAWGPLLLFVPLAAFMSDYLVE
jgi:lipopolysaccharide export system permease protein